MWGKMNLFGKFLPAVRRLLSLQRTQDEQPRTSRIWWSPRTTAGVYIDPDRSLQNATVWACVRYLTSAVGQCRWRVMRETANGSERVPTHPLDYVIGTRPNPEMGSFTFRQALLGDALLWGNGYAEIERDQANRVVALHYVHPCRVNPRRDEVGRLVYEISNYTGAAEVLQPSDVFHLRGYGSGPVGFNVVQYAAQSIGASEAIKLFGSSYFGEGMNPSGIIEIPGAMTPEGMASMDEQMSRLYAGPKGKRTMYLDKGMKFNKITTTPNESQFNETAKFYVEEICRFFGVPPHKVMHLERSTFSNIEHQAIEVVTDTIAPWAKLFMEEADYKLFGNNRQGFYTDIDLKGLLRGDSAARAALITSHFGVGALSTNDVLSLEDMNTIGPEGDQRFISQNLQPLNAEERNKLNAPQPAAQPSAGDAPMNFSAAREALRNGNGQATQH